MPYNGSGTFTRLYNWVTDAANAVRIRADRMDDEFNSIATGLTTALTKDGQTTPTAALPMGGFNHTGVGAATARNHYATMAQVQDQGGVYVATVGGTADAITLTPAPAITAYAAGQRFAFIASGTNTTNVTIATSGLATRAVTKFGAVALVAGDITTGDIVTIHDDGTRYQLLSSVRTPAFTAGAIPTAALADNAVTLAKLEDGTQGDVLYYGAAGAPARLGAGTNGFFLKTQGAGANPTWAQVDEQDHQFVSTAAITATATLPVTSMEAGYDYFITLEAFAPTDDSQVLLMRFSDDAGVSYEADASDYSWAARVSTLAAQDEADTAIHLTGNGGSGTSLGNDAGNVNTVEVKLINPNASSEKTTATWQGVFMGDAATPATILATGGGIFQQGADAVAAVQFLWSGGGNFKAQGDITVWRRKRS